MQVDTLDTKRWMVIYPAFINAKKTVQQGRRVALAHAADNPTANEIAECCKHLGFQVVVEADKAYPRDWLVKGRVRVYFKDENGQPVHPEIKKKQELLKRVGQLVNRMVHRQSKKQDTVVPQGKKKKGKK